jgi:hypothetical protein
MNYLFESPKIAATRKHALPASAIAFITEWDD